MTASASSRASTSSKSAQAWPMPYLRATSSACSSLRLTTEVTVTPSIRASASRCLMPKAPAPASAIRMWLVLFRARRVGRLQHEVAERGVGCRDMVVPVQLGDGPAERAPHDQPVDKLDALGACLAQVLNVRQRGELGRI